MFNCCGDGVAARTTPFNGFLWMVIFWKLFARNIKCAKTCTKWRVLVRREIKRQWISIRVGRHYRRRASDPISLTAKVQRVGTINRSSLYILLVLYCFSLSSSRVESRVVAHNNDPRVCCDDTRCDRKNKPTTVYPSKISIRRAHESKFNDPRSVYHVTPVTSDVQQSVRGGIWINCERTAPITIIYPEQLYAERFDTEGRISLLLYAASDCARL